MPLQNLGGLVKKRLSCHVRGFRAHKFLNILEQEIHS